MGWVGAVFPSRATHNFQTPKSIKITGKEMTTAYCPGCQMIVTVWTRTYETADAHEMDYDCQSCGLTLSTMQVNK